MCVWCGSKQVSNELVCGMQQLNAKLCTTSTVHPPTPLSQAMAEAFLLKPVNGSCLEHKSRPLASLFAVQDRYESMVQSIHQGAMRDISHVYHVTNPEQKERIIREGKIECQLLQLKNQAAPCFSGIFIECNLSTSIDVLPEYSSHGSERLKFPIGALKGEGQHLFFHSFWDDNDGNRSVLMVLKRDIDNDVNPPGFFINFLHEVDMKKNPLIQLDFACNTFRCMQFYDCHGHPIWLELLVVGDVPITSEQEWHHVLDICLNTEQDE